MKLNETYSSAKNYNKISHYHRGFENTTFSRLDFGIVLEKKLGTGSSAYHMPSPPRLPPYQTAQFFQVERSSHLITVWQRRHHKINRDIEIENVYLTIYNHLQFNYYISVAVFVRGRLVQGEGGSENLAEQF